MPDFGQKPALVLIPGIQGRWEWMAPAVRALDPDFQVLTFSLSDPSRSPSDPTDSATWFDRWTAHVDQLLDAAGAHRAVVAGVSFGGLVALHYAARRPDRARALVLASTPGPRMGDDSRYDQRLRYPVLALPGFAIRGARRMAREVAATHPGWVGRARFALPQLARTLTAPMSPRQMAAWVKAWRAVDLAADCRAITAPTLLITGEPDLDRIVPVDSSRQYLDLIPGSRHVTMPRTGHLGVVLQADQFARIVTDFSRDAG